MQGTQLSFQFKPTREILVYSSAGPYWGRDCYGKSEPQEIAKAYGCKLEFREGKFVYNSLEQYTPTFSARMGIYPNGDCISAVLVGDDLEALRQARDHLHDAYGGDGKSKIGRIITYDKPTS